MEVRVALLQWADLPTLKLPTAPSPAVTVLWARSLAMGVVEKKMGINGLVYSGHSG